MAESGRVFLRGITSENYGLKDFRAAQLAAPRVRDDSVVVDDGKVGHTEWLKQGQERVAGGPRR